LGDVQGLEWAVKEATTRRFRAEAWARATEVLQSLALPLIDEANRQTERARVQLAMIKLAAGDVDALERLARMASRDWRDVLVAAGLANGNWRQVLAADGYLTPAEPNRGT